jgi:hypothetical protein
MVRMAGAVVIGAETVLGLVLVGTEADDAVVETVKDERVGVVMEGVGVGEPHLKQLRSYQSKGLNCCALSADRR